MQTIQDRINKYYDEWEYYCLPDRNQKCKATVEEFMKQIDVLMEQVNDSKKKEKAKLLYLKAKIQDILPYYQKSSEELLNKSVKLNPSNGDCWNILAHVLFKKKDIEGAKKAIEMALESKGKNKVSLKYLSVLLRTQQKNQAERRNNIQQSVKIIKEALLLDMKDPGSWYFLGNAYISNFFANFKKFDELQNAVKAYNQAEKYFKYQYPDLYISRGNVLMHMQAYEKAIQDYRKCMQIDPSINLNDKIEIIHKRMDYSKVSFDRVKQLKQSKIQQIVKTVPNSSPNNKIQIASIKNLKPRFNLGKTLSAKIINKLTGGNDIPMSFLVIDSQGNFLSVSIYNADSVLQQRIKKDTLIAITDPEVYEIKFGQFTYISIQVFETMKLYIDGKQLISSEFNPNIVINQIFQK